MGKLKNNVFKFFITLTLGIIIGMLIGAISLNVFISYRIDQYLKEITYLNTIIEERDIRLEKLEESINKSKFILGKVEINLIYDGDEIDKLTLKKYISQKYNNILGKEVKNIDIEMVAEVIDNRIMKVNENEYKLKVKKVLLTDVLKIWVEVK